MRYQVSSDFSSPSSGKCNVRLAFLSPEAILATFALHCIMIGANKQGRFKPCWYHSVRMYHSVRTDHIVIRMNHSGPLCRQGRSGHFPVQYFRGVCLSNLGKGMSSRNWVLLCARAPPWPVLTIWFSLALTLPPWSTKQIQHSLFESKARRSLCRSLYSQIR